MTSDACRELLSTRGLKVTAQRTCILQALAAWPDHPTAEMLHARVAAAVPGLSLGTLYKALEVFVDHGLAKRIYCEAHIARFELVISEHHHVVCSQTQAVHDYHDTALDDMLRAHFAAHPLQGFELESFELLLRAKPLAPQASPTSIPNQ